MIHDINKCKFLLTMGDIFVALLTLLIDIIATDRFATLSDYFLLCAEECANGDTAPLEQ